MCSSDYSRIQSVLMLQPTCGLFQGFIVNHRDRNGEGGSGTPRPPPRSLLRQITALPLAVSAAYVPIMETRRFAQQNACDDWRLQLQKTGAGATHSYSNTFERLGWCSGFSSVHKNLPVFLPHAAGCLQKDAFKLRTNEFEVSSLVCFFFFIQRDKYANFTHEVLIRTFFVYPIHM